MKPDTSEYLEIDGRRCHVRRWAQPGAPRLFLLHGWLDTSITFQFLVDSFQHDWDIIAPDWQGYGESQWLHQQYSMLDDVRILDAILDQYSPGAAASLVGHSYGGQVASLYSGSRPERVAHCISLEGFGPRQQPLSAAPGLMSSWLKRSRVNHEMKRHASFSALAQRLIKANPRLTPERADFLARGIGQAGTDGDQGVTLRADPWRRVRGMPLSFPPADYFETFLAAISAPALWLRGDSSHYMEYVFPELQLYQDRFAQLAEAEDVLITDAGHNLHHDQPEQVAQLTEAFLDRHQVTETRKSDRVSGL